MIPVFICDILIIPCNQISFLCSENIKNNKEKKIICTENKQELQIYTQRDNFKILIKSI